MNTLSVSNFRAIIAACLLTVATAAPALHAQWNRTVGRMNVPFAFEVGKTRLPAGQYDISEMADHVILIRGESAHAVVMVNHEAATGPTQHGKIVFARYGDQYFMRELWNQGSTIYESCVESKDESQTRATIAAVTHKRENGVQVAISIMPSF